MKKSFKSINHSLALTISVGIMLFVMAVFAVSLGFLFVRSRQLVKQEAMERAERTLDNKVMRVKRCLDEVESATANIAWMIDDYLNPDSLLSYTHRIVELNPHVNGCSVTMEPNFFGPAYGDFSVYSLRYAGTIETVVEGKYNYYEKVWYKTPREKGKPCWVDPYNDFNAGTLSSIPMIVSYGMPLQNIRGDFIGVISTDLAVPLFNDIVSAKNPYDLSYCFMLSSTGDYVVHPDRTKMVRQGIFTDLDEQKHPDIAQLGKEMIAGKTGNMSVRLNGEACIVFYEPVPGTGWSIALVVPEKEIYATYDSLKYIVIPLLVVGLLLLLLVCWKIVSHFVKPIGLLAQSARHITLGHFDEHLPQSDRIDVVGHLQNNFIYMQDAVDDNINHIHQMNAVMAERIKELDEANQQAKEADIRKAEFLKDVSMQLRTPLNIIAGFMQVLRENRDNMKDEEVQCQMNVMKEHSMVLRRMSRMIFDSSWMDTRPNLDLSKEVYVNEFVQKVISEFNLPRPKGMVFQYSSELPDTKFFHTNPLYLLRVLRELLYNAVKFSSQEYIALYVEGGDDVIRFIVEDKGKGFSGEERLHMYVPFAKSDPFSAGLGLGLSLSLQTAQMLGGSLELDTSYTEGARFILSLPDK